MYISPTPNVINNTVDVLNFQLPTSYSVKGTDDAICIVNIHNNAVESVQKEQTNPITQHPNKLCLVNTGKSKYTAKDL